MNGATIETFVAAPQNEGQPTFEGVVNNSDAFGSTLLNLFNTGASIYGAVTGKATPTTAAKAAAAPAKTNWKLYAGIAAGVVVLVVLLFRRK